MISCQDLQLEYNDLYIEMRKYIWDFHVVEALADLELACYKACVDLNEVRDCFDMLKRSVLHVINDDEDFANAFDTFEQFLDDNDTIYTPLFKVKEEMTYEDIKEREEDQHKAPDEGSRSRQSVRRSRNRT